MRTLHAFQSVNAGVTRATHGATFEDAQEREAFVDDIARLHDSARCRFTGRERDTLDRILQRLLMNPGGDHSSHHTAEHLAGGPRPCGPRHTATELGTPIDSPADPGASDARPRAEQDNNRWMLTDGVDHTPCPSTRTPRHPARSTTSAARSSTYRRTSATVAIRHDPPRPRLRPDQPLKVKSEDNVADVVTKPLTGATFARPRAAIIGLAGRGPRRGGRCRLERLRGSGARRASDLEVGCWLGQRSACASGSRCTGQWV